MSLAQARRLLALHQVTATRRPLTALERNAASCLKARIRSLTGNHFAA